MVDQPTATRLTRAEIEATADLAALELDEESLARLSRALATVLEHFEVIAKVEVPGTLHGTPVERSVGLADLRPDEGRQQGVSSLHAAAPDFEEGFFFVPRVIL